MAQQVRTWRIGYLMDRSGPVAFDEAFVQGLRENGYVVGQNVTIEYRWTEGQSARLPALANDLVSQRVDVIVTAGAASVKALKAATATIPIVMASSQDAVADGLVASLAHPGGNVTGRSVYGPELTPKRLELLKAALPGLSRVGILWNSQNPGGLNQFREAEAAGQSLGIHIVSLNTRFPDDLEPVMAQAARAGATAVLTLSDSSTITFRAEIAAAAQRHRLATMFSNAAYLAGGGLMSYGPDLVETFRLAAGHVDKILKGAKPADLPVEQPSRFEFVINMKAAEQLGLTIPPALLLQADKLID
ncbi:ABC transporter substrate-binding protein [Microvirga calopogonii]|uniref:ABC transporter substrate-binding protein n=1 Tax=Microvirga calopogonii TaxID=2078013 RepID=UPI0013B3BA73|nr:ABC transporter substrate-binding protein [Microvirga calopogonii]